LFNRKRAVLRRTNLAPCEIFILLKGAKVVRCGFREYAIKEKAILLRNYFSAVAQIKLHHCSAEFHNTLIQVVQLKGLRSKIGHTQTGAA
jgi:hypothetical protein